MKIIGLTCHYTGNHDNSAALLIDGVVKFAESEERISRIKHDKHFPSLAIGHALKFCKLRRNEIDYYVSASPPTNAFIWVNYYLYGLKYTSLKVFLKWFIQRLIFVLSARSAAQEDKRPNTYQQWKGHKDKLRFVSHYLAHAETAYTFSNIDKCLVVSWDGYGVREDGSPLCGGVYLGNKGELKLLEEITPYASLALYYGAVTVGLGFKLNDGEGKTMGLAAYGKKSGAIEELKKIFPYFDKSHWEPRTNWLEINGVSRPDYFKKTDAYNQIQKFISKYSKENVAFAAQAILEEESAKFFKYLIKKYKVRSVAVSGGIFLNVKFNTKLLEEKIVDRLFIYPNPGDGGVAVGAAISLYKKLGFKVHVSSMETVSLGCEFSDHEILLNLKKFNKKINYIKLGKDLPKIVAKEISQGTVIGWFQGRGEWGPRALGSRSVLADPRVVETKERINSKLKQRDWFMPFAPAILEEYSSKVLKHNFGTPFMTLTDDVRPSIARNLLAAIHIDKTARAQILRKKTHPLYWQVVKEFYKLTRIPVILNTSFNRHGLPIVHSPSEAIEHLLWGCVDKLVIGSYLVVRR
jgi:carbamoyltransferase